MNISLLLSILVMFTPASAQDSLPGSIATLKTSMGDIRIRLFPKDAPQTVATFVGLATGSKSFSDVKTGKTMRDVPFYKDMIFHKIHPKLGIQTGCPFGDGRGWPGFTLRDEAKASMKFDRRFLVALAKIPGQKSSGGSQFFITTEISPHLNGKYVIFGEVTSGTEVVEKVSRQEIDAMMRPINPIRLKEVLIE